MKEDKIIGHIYYIIKDVIDSGKVIMVKFHKEYEHWLQGENPDGSPFEAPMLLDEIEINGIKNSSLSVSSICVESEFEDDFTMDLSDLLKLTNLGMVLIGIIIDNHEKVKAELLITIKDQSKLIRLIHDSNKARAKLDAAKS